MEHKNRLPTFFKLIPAEWKFQAIDVNGTSIITDGAQNFSSCRQTHTGRMGCGGERRGAAGRPAEVIHLPLDTPLRGPRAGMALTVTQHVPRYFGNRDFAKTQLLRRPIQRPLRPLASAHFMCAIPCLATEFHQEQPDEKSHAKTTERLKVRSRKAAN